MLFIILFLKVTLLEECLRFLLKVGSQKQKKGWK